MNKKFDFNDFVIEPAIISEISSRSEVNPFTENGMLPLIASPMDTVVNLTNYKCFLENKIKVCLPRGKGITSMSEMVFKSISLDEFILSYVNLPKIITTCEYILIDIANGHQTRLINAIKIAKEIYGNRLFLMVGNIANPYTYKILSEAGADAIRVGIGGGSACTTSANTSIHYPMASLIKECYVLKIDNQLTSHIICDGGMKGYSDIIKAIALGADYVMLGGIFNKTLESCGETRIFKIFKINPQKWLARWFFHHKFKITKVFRGMSTKEAQKDMGNTILKTSEGINRIKHVEYSLNGWTRNFEDYLRSAMSYTNSKTLDDFRGNVNINFITEQAFKRFDK